MYFNPVSAGKLVDALRRGDEAEAFLNAIEITQCEELVNSAVLPTLVYNDTELAELIEAKLKALVTASVAIGYGTLVPEITGLALSYLERMAYQEDDDGKTDSQSEQQSKQEDAPGA